MRILSRNDIKEIADRIITAYKNMPSRKGKVLHKVDPEALVHDLLGLNIEYKHLSPDRSILGLTSFGNIGIQIYDDNCADDVFILDDQTVLVERDLRDAPEMNGRCNFTLMHEGSHQIYRILYPREYGLRYRKEPVHFYRRQEYKSKRITDWEEWQTNTLASYLLLPRECVERSLFMFGFGEKITMLNKTYASRQYDRFVDMAIFLGVSKTALAIRLKQLGLLDKDCLYDPYEFINITREDGLCKKKICVTRIPSIMQRSKHSKTSCAAKCDGMPTIVRICPYCKHKISEVVQGNHGFTFAKCTRCSEDVIFPPVCFRLRKSD